MTEKDKFNKIILVILSCNNVKQINACIKIVYNWHLIRKSATEAWLISLLYDLIEIQFKKITLETYLI